MSQRKLHTKIITNNYLLNIRSINITPYLTWVVPNVRKLCGGRSSGSDYQRVIYWMKNSDSGVTRHSVSQTTAPRLHTTPPYPPLIYTTPPSHPLTRKLVLASRRGTFNLCKQPVFGISGRECMIIKSICTPYMCFIIERKMGHDEYIVVNIGIAEWNMGKKNKGKL